MLVHWYVESIKNANKFSINVQDREIKIKVTLVVQMIKNKKDSIIYSAFKKFNYIVFQLLFLAFLSRFIDCCWSYWRLRVALVL